MKGIALLVALGVMSATMAPSVTKADPQVLTDSQMDAVTAAAGIVHLNLPVFSVILLNVPNIEVTANVNLGDIVVKNNHVIANKVITQVAVATTVGVAACGICLGSPPQVTATASVFNTFFTRHGLP